MFSRLLKLQGNYWLFALPLVLALFGLVLIYDASSVSAMRDFGDQFHYVANQGVWFGIGLVAFLCLSKIDYRLFKKIALPLFLVNLFLLVIVLLPGIGAEIMGSRRWLAIGSFVFQPAEMMKLSLVIYLATLLAKPKKALVFVAILGTVLLLLLLEPDLGTAVILGSTGMALYYLAGATLTDVGKVLASFLSSGLLAALISPYRRNRLITFFNPQDDTLGKSYHVRQILIALGSGGLLGRGFGQSRQKYLYLPEATTDSIFAVFAEEFGLLGCLALIGCFVLLIVQGLKVASHTTDQFGKLLASGIIFFIGIQTVINLSAMVALLPLTGVPLPFISYGGSSLCMCLAGMGIVYNIAKSNQSR